MSHAYAYRDDPAERERVAVALAKMGVSFPTRPGAKVVPLDANPTKRKPLGLAPILDDNERAPERDTPGLLEAKRLIAEAIASLSPEARAQPATIEHVFEGLELPLAISFDDADATSKSFRELRAELAEIKAARREEAAELRATVRELRAELSQMRSIQESARIASRGEAGIQGPRGIPGPPGVGQIGPQGPRGEMGPTAKIAAWVPDVEAFSLAPTYADGSRAVPLNLRPFFEAYNAATSADEE
jgi:hypothetical protein